MALKLGEEIYDLIYPIGSIYETTSSSFNPNSTFGGTWEKIENRFLIGASSTYTLGSTGGSEYASAQIEAFTINGNRLYLDYNQQGFISTAQYTTVSRRMVEGNYTEDSDTHYEVQGSGIKVSNTNNANTLLPPYLAVYMWKRVS